MSEFWSGVIGAIIGVLGTILVAIYQKKKPKIHIIESSQEFFPNTIRGENFLKFSIKAKNIGDAPAHIFKAKSSWYSDDINVTIQPATDEVFSFIGPQGDYKEMKEISIYIHGKLFPIKHRIQRPKYLIYND